tara:strand:- start:6009 stop:6851 length:843 start_codon:yes stop_codon:yes gene_type:complete
MDTRLYNQNLSADLKLFQNLVEAKTLNKPFRTPKGPKKFSVYVKNEKGNVVKVNFGDPNMEIKRDDPNRRKNFRARHNCDNPGPKTKARYWSCKMWEAKKSVTDYTKGSDDSWDGETLYDHKVLLSLNPILAKAEEIKEEPEEKEDDCCGCGGCEEAVAAKRSGPRSAAQTPSKPSERRKGSSKNKKGSAGKGGPSITFSEKTTQALKNKVKEHNEKHPTKKVTLSQLKKVYRRGAGAFSQSHRPGQSRGSWAMARVNMFLKMKRGGKVKKSYRDADGDI